MEDQKMPDGTCHGKDLPDRGVSSGVSDTYGAKNGDLERGFSGRSSIGKDTRSDS